jgi:hypothetical protein
MHDAATANPREEAIHSSCTVGYVGSYGEFRWVGPWQLDRDVRVLRMRDADYEVDLDRCLTSAETLD